MFESVEKTLQSVPISPPVCDRRGVFFAPGLLQFIQRDKGRSFVGSLVDLFEVCAKRSAVLVVEILDRFAKLMRLILELASRKDSNQILLNILS